MGLPEAKYRKLIKDLKPCLINIGVDRDISIRELAELVKDIVAYPGKIVFDTGKPDGTPQKLLDVARMDALGWKARISLRQGIESTYRWYKDRIPGL